MNRRTPFRVSASALLLSALAYAVSWYIAFATTNLTFTDPSIPLAWDFWASTLRFWSVLAVGLSAIACIMTYVGFRDHITRKSRKVMFWTSGALLFFAVLPVSYFIWSFDRPIHIRNRALLRAINATSRTLIAKRLSKADDELFRRKGYIDVPKNQWPRPIAALSPRWVTVFHGPAPDFNGPAVDIMMAGYFDGGWGYWIQPGVKQRPRPEGRFEYLGEDVYAYHPY